MENGFSEVGKIVDNRINSEKLQDIKWTKENLEKWKILLDEHSRMHILQYSNEEQFVKIRTNIEGGTLCNDYKMRTISECEVEKVDESFIYWFRTEHRFRVLEYNETENEKEIRNIIGSFILKIYSKKYFQ